MALLTGSQLGPYQIVAPLGVGGMGEVYRAHDSRLRREVAIKVVPEATAHDAVRMARFAREAQFLAALNHPNIGSIYGFEESSTMLALVMELVEGPTLADRIAQGPIPVEDALPILKQIAEALEYAHDRGIVHRDLKPANIKIKPDGTVKVLDFGLAKALSDDINPTDISNSPTLTAAATKAGLILGTAAYMAPEQARGKAVDRRADIWSFGAVAFEMLTGKMAFKGDTVSDTLAAVIRGEPEWTFLPASVPNEIQQLIRRCLNKDPRQRLQSIGEARIAIENVMESRTTPMQGPSISAASISAATLEKENRALKILAGCGLAALLIAAGFLVANLLHSGSTRENLPIRFAILPPPGTSLNSVLRTVAISQDGSRIALSATSSDGPRLYLRDMNSASSIPIAGAEGAVNPVFSPDGRWLAFFAAGKLKKISLDGGAPVVVADGITSPKGLSWGTDHNIYFAPSLSSAIVRVSDSGGPPQAATKLQADKGELADFSPDVLPDGKTLLFTAFSGGNMDDGALVAQKIGSDERKVIVAKGADAHFFAPNHLLYVRGGNLMIAEFNTGKLETTGSPAVVVQDVLMQPATGLAQYDVSSSGTLIYVNGGKQAVENSLVLAEHDAKVQPLPVKPNLYESPRFSPDGKLLALTVRLPDPDIWVYDMERGALRRITFAPGEDELPVWSPDGKRIAFASNGRQQAFMVAVDGSGQEERLMKNESHFHLQSWSPDGKIIAYERLGSSGQYEIWMLPLDGDRKPYPYLVSQFHVSQPAFSKDGNWLAYTSNESGRSEVYVQRFPGPGEKIQVSTDGGNHPVWSRDGKQLVYENTGTLWATEVLLSPFRVGKSRVLYQGDIWNDAAGPNYTLAPGGHRIVVVERIKDPEGGNVKVVVNWNQELQVLSSSK
ncbi:MAG TPA: protein kinase [Candidatus Acidoferrales bacterium]|nr:protein kinase [Candidatus Acidoferrales bacterium]